MSLNFVSTAVLSSTDGVSHNTETRVENSDTTSISRSDNYKPLFEQLRQNAQEEQDKYDEVTKAMRGTRTLDDEDIAHLQGLEDERANRLRLQELKEKEELESFRLAKIDYQDANKLKQENQRDENILQKNKKRNSASVEQLHGNEDSKNSSTLIQLQPKFMVTKKRRRKTHVKALLTDSESCDRGENNDDNVNTESKKSFVTSLDSFEKDENNEGGLGGLLSGYGSDSDSN